MTLSANKLIVIVVRQILNFGLLRDIGILGCGLKFTTLHGFFFSDSYSFNIFDSLPLYAN